MDLVIKPGKLSGTISAIPSKSQAHRYLICAAFSDGPTEIICRQTNRDIEATRQCLCALGADITRTETGYIVSPINKLPESAVLPCDESGSTLRFLLPIVGAMGVKATFKLSGRLAQRPLSPLWEEMERMGCQLSRPSENTVLCCGRLKPGHYTIDGGVSSQYITGLLFSLSLLDGISYLKITGNIESAPYIQITTDALKTFGVDVTGKEIRGMYPYQTPGMVYVEGDWSNAAFFLAANTIGSSINITGLNRESSQGDKAVLTALERLECNAKISAKDIPDLIPILAVTAAAKQGAVFTHIERLRLKESDRAATVCAMLKNLGITAAENQSEIVVIPGTLTGGIVDSANDHRIAMAAAIAATVAEKPVIIKNADCVSKSYPEFWNDYRILGGQYEQYLW